MRFIICCLLLLTLMCFAVMYVASPWLDLQFVVDQKIRAQDFHGAKQVCERVYSLRPSLFHQWSNARIGEVSIAAAEAELRKSPPDFSAAQDWLSDLLKRASDPTGSEGRATHMLKKIPSLHYHYARQMFLLRDYQQALSEFEEISRLYPNDPVQGRLKTEAHVAQIEAASTLNESGDPEAALDLLAKLNSSVHLPPGMLVKALGVVPAIAERAIRGRIRQSDFITAFNLMEGIHSRFTDPEVLSGLADTRERIDLELFGEALESGLRTKTTPSPVRPTPSGGSEKAIVRVKNGTGSAIRLIYVGPQRLEVELPANSERAFELEPGRYLTGVYWPTNRGLRPSRGEDVIPAGVYRKAFELSAPVQGTAFSQVPITLPMQLN